MNWKQKFNRTILERGNEYYKQKQVHILYTSDSRYNAMVIGTSIYHVEIEVKNGEAVDMSCSCPYSEKGYYCKHMAAVMYAIEEQGGLQQKTKVKQKENKVKPFEISEDTYRYFDMGRIASELEVEESKVSKAKKLLEENQVSLESIDIGYYRFMGGTVLAGVVEGQFKEGNVVRKLTCMFDREHIIRAECGSYECRCYYHESYNWGKLDICSHLLALLYLTNQYLKKYNPGDTTDGDGEFLLSGFRNQQGKTGILGMSRETMDFHLELIFEKTGSGLALGLRAGTNKLYVVKNIPEFVNLYETKGIIKFGTKTQIDLAEHRMCAESEELYRLVHSIVKEEESRIAYERENYRFYYGIEEIKQRIPLFGNRLDRFFNLYQGSVVECTEKKRTKTEKISYLFEDGKPNLTLKIEKDVDKDQTFHGIYVSGKMPDFIDGAQHQYYFTKKAFCRVGGEHIEEIKPLLELGKYGDISFTVGRKNLSEFYHQVLPTLKRSVKVKEVDAEYIQEYIPPEAVCAFYLDAEQGRILCKAQAQYGEDNYSLLDNLREEQGYEWFRNLNREAEVLEQVQNFFPIVDLQKDELYCEESEEALVELIDGGIDKLMTLGEVNTTERFRSINIRKKPRLKIGVSIKSDLMNLSVSSEDIEQEELLQLLQSFKRKKKYYRLKSGDLISVSETDMEMLQQMIDAMQLSPKEFVKGNMKIPMYRALYLNKMLEQGENISLSRDSQFKNMIKEFKTVEDSEFEVPDSLATIMRGYQVRGFKWMKTLEHYGFGGILADDMGLGKTLQAISVLLEAKKSGKEGTALIVSPASLVYNWKEEFQKYAPELKVNLIVGSQQERAELIKNYESYDVLVTSYDLLKRDIAEYQDAKFRYQIIDEAQYIKNHSTAAAKSVKVIQSKYRLALTGTPIENRLSELWSIFDYLMPGFLYGYETFRKDMETPIVKNKDEQTSERLKKMVAPFILRRLKGDVLSDLPDKLEEIRYAKLETEQQKLYDGQVVHMKKMLAAQKGEEFQKNKLQVLAELTKIRQICCDPELLFENYMGKSAKREACMELIQSAIEGEHKILVFSQFTSMLALLEEELQKEKIAYFKITGETPKQKRVELVNTFNSDDTRVFLISLKAGGTGLNLTGADVVIHYDPWWNQAAQNQATDRAHRIGQTKAVSVYKLIVKDTIEEKIVKMQESKKDLADAILSGENGSITQMSKEEIMELLEG